MNDEAVVWHCVVIKWEMELLMTKGGHAFVKVMIWFYAIGVPDLHNYSPSKTCYLLATNNTNHIEYIDQSVK